MSTMFQTCSKLKSLNVKNFITDKVTDMSFMFYNCSNLKDIDVSNFNAKNVTSSKNMFYNLPIIDKIKKLSNFKNLKDIY